MSYDIHLSLTYMQEMCLFKRGSCSQNVVVVYLKLIFKLNRKYLKVL